MRDARVGRGGAGEVDRRNVAAVQRALDRRAAVERSEHLHLHRVGLRGGDRRVLPTTVATRDLRDALALLDALLDTEQG